MAWPVWLPRLLHPAAWWLWALGLATAASRTTNPLLLALVVAVTGYVVMARRTNAPWASSYAAFLKLGLVVIALRVIFATLFGTAVEGPTVVVTLPEIPLPAWAAGIRLGGAVSLEGLVMAVYEGMRLATLLVCLGAANALASPSRLIKVVPAALYEVGVAVVVAMTFTPQLVAEVHRVRAARRLRGRPDRGLRSMPGVALPVLEESLARSLALAAAMDSRGYGRTGHLPGRQRLLTAVLTLGGLLGICVGLYGSLDGASPRLLGLPLLGLGVAVAGVGLTLAGRRSPRSRYRPDPWAAPEWLVAGSGVAAAASVVLAAALGVDGLHPSTLPLQVPTLPLLPAAGIVIALLPAWVAPPVPSPLRRGRSGAARPVPATERPAEALR